MTENKRNIMVALFVILGLTALGWMIFKFGDLPVLVSSYDARNIEIYFPEAPRIQENSQILFRGFPVGRVIKIHPPALMPDLENPQLETYQLVIEAAIARDYNIPKNATPKVYSRGLGGSFLEFTLPDNEPPSRQLLADGDRIKGYVSEASEFLSEKTQKKLDNLIASLTALSDELQGQLTTIPPEQVDKNPDTVKPNVTTAVIRMDQVLKNLNQVVADPQNRQNIKTTLAQFAELSVELRQLAAQTKTLIEKSQNTVSNIDSVVQKSSKNIDQLGPAIQNVADQLALTLKHMDELILAASKGQGSAAHFINDPSLYESLNDAAKNLSITLEDFRTLIQKWNEKGLLAK